MDVPGRMVPDEPFHDVSAASDASHVSLSWLPEFLYLPTQLLATRYPSPITAELRSAPHAGDQMRHGDAEADQTKEDHDQ